jgi:hypothetical protein
MPSTNSFPTDMAFRDKRGRVILRIGILLTLYFERGFDLGVRRKLHECTDYVRKLSRGPIRWVLLPDDNQWQRYEESHLERYKRWMHEAAVEDESWQTVWSSGKNLQEASEFEFTVLAVEEPGLSYAQLALPIELRSQLPAIALHLAELLQPQQGYGGYGFIESNDLEVEDMAQPLVYSMAQRFPGIEVDRPVSHNSFLDAGIKGVNWLTLLGPRWVNKLPAEEALRATLGDGYVVAPYNDGLMIQSGPEPEIGDTNQQLWPRYYPKLARLLEPIRVKDVGSFHYYGVNRFTRATSAQWLARFDKDPEF